MQFTSSPWRPLNSENTLSRSASRTSEPSSAAGSRRCAAESDFLAWVRHRVNYRSQAIDHDIAGILIQVGDQVLLRLEVLAGRRQHGVLHRIHHNLRVNTLFFAQYFNRLIDRSHVKPLFKYSF